MSTATPSLDQCIELLKLVGLKPISITDSGRIRTPIGTKTVDAVIKQTTKEVAKVYKSGKEMVMAYEYLTASPAEFMEVLVEGLVQTKEVSTDLLDLQKNTEALTLNVNLSDAEDIFLTNNDCIRSIVSAEVYAMVRGIPLEELCLKARFVLPKYYPRIKDKLFYEKQDDGKEHTVLNTYTEPAWSKVELNEPKLPTLLIKILKHLVPIEEEREYLLDWIHSSLTNRARVYLLLCGVPGIGKTALKDLLRVLHGDTNFVAGKKSTLTTQFNSQLAEGTLLCFDELRYSEEEENVMKEIPNSTVSIEKKGVDATRGTEIYASLLINNNKLRDNYLGFDSRKFVPLTLNQERLETSVTPEEIQEFYTKISKETMDLDFVANIGQYIVKHGKSTKWPNGEYKTPMFYRITHSSMAKWQKKLLELLRKLEEKLPMDCSDLEAEFIKSTKKTNIIFPDYSTVMYFLQIFRDLKGNKVYEVQEYLDSISGDFEIKLFKEEDALDGL